MYQLKNNTIRITCLLFGILGFMFGLIPILDTAQHIFWFISKEMAQILNQLVETYIGLFSAAGFFAPIVGILLCLASLVIGFLSIGMAEEKRDKINILVGVALAGFGLAGNFVSFFYFIFPD